MIEKINEMIENKQYVELRRVIADLTAQLIKAHDQLEEKGLLDEKNKTVESV